MQISGNEQKATVKYIHELGFATHKDGNRYRIVLVVRRFHYMIILACLRDKSIIIARDQDIDALKIKVKTHPIMNSIMENTDVLINKFPADNRLGWYSRMPSFPVAMQIYEKWMSRRSS